jgi:tetratricopeptide (TPR) repeat protein
MNEPHDPNVTADHIAATPAEALGTTDHTRGAASTADSHPGAGAGGDLPAVPGYRVLHEIARGGMGCVLAAYDPPLDRDVALKILLPGANADRFVRESKITARLPHPGIPPVHALGTLADGSPFLAMKLIAGRTLADEMKSADRPRLLQAFTQVCQAVGFAHSRGIIHRHLKPANVLVGAFGEVQVMDWGLAKDLTSQEVPVEPRASESSPAPVVGADPRATTAHRAAGESTDDQTQAGQVMGTPAYMAPEQARSEATDARADVFALGGILCAILTGKPPFSGKSALEVMQRAAAANLAEANARLDRCGADEELIALCRRCLSPNPAGRPADGQAVADGVTAYLDGVQEKLRKAELAQAEAKAKAIEEAKRRRLRRVLVATVLLAALVAGGVGLWWKLDRDAKHIQVNREAGEALAQAQQFRERARTATTGGSGLYALARGQAQRAAALAENELIDPELKDQVNHLQTELDEELEDHTLVAALDEAILAPTEESSLTGPGTAPGFAYEKAVPEFRKAFAAYRMPVGQGDPAAAAQRIRNRPPEAWAAIVTAMMEWEFQATYRKAMVNEPHLEWLRAVMDAADEPDSWHRKIRSALREGHKDKILKTLREWVGTADLKSASIRRLAHLFLDVLPPAEGVPLLRRVQQQHPGDFWVNYALGMACRFQSPPDVAEGVRFLTAAAAIRPKSSGVFAMLGNALSDAGRLDEAAVCYQQSIHINPSNALPHHNLGNLLARQERFDEALVQYRKALELDPKAWLQRVNLGITLGKKGLLDEAIASSRKAVELCPKGDRGAAKAHSQLGHALCAKNLWDEAIASCRKAIALDPNFITARIGLSNALRGKGLMKEALANVEEALKLHPKNAELHSSRGAYLAEKGQLDDAAAALRETIKLDPKFAPAYANMSKIHLVRNQLDEGIASVRKAIELDPKNIVAYSNLAILLRRKGKVDDALAAGLKAVELDPKSAAAHNNLCRTYLDKGQIDQALASVRKAIELEPKNAEFVLNLARALVNYQKWDEMIVNCNRHLELNPNTKEADAYSFRGMAFENLGKFDKARSDYQKAIELDPKDFLPRMGMARSLTLEKKFDEAIPHFRKVAELQPKDALTHLLLAQALQRTGQIDEAIVSYKKVVDLDPKNVPIRAKVAELLEKQKRYAESAVYLGKLVELVPTDPKLYQLRGLVQEKAGQLDQAIVSFRKATTLSPTEILPWFLLGKTVAKQKGGLEEAVKCFRKVIELNPKYASAHFNLGIMLWNTGKREEAIASYRKAIELAPTQGYYYHNLSLSLKGTGRWVEARDAAARALKLTAPNHPRRAAMAINLAVCEKYAKVEIRLSALISGKEKLTSAQEGLDAAILCIKRKLPYAGVRLRTAAFALDPNSADDLKAGHRYNGACDAALAAAGQGKDADKLDDKERARLRKQALDWLRADLTAWTKRLKSSEPADRADVLRHVKHWQEDSDFVGIRDKEALARLPEAERQAFTQLWADVAALRKQAETPPTQEGKK